MKLLTYIFQFPCPTITAKKKFKCGLHIPIRLHIPLHRKTNVDVLKVFKTIIAILKTPPYSMERNANCSTSTTESQKCFPLMKSHRTRVWTTDKMMLTSQDYVVQWNRQIEHRLWPGLMPYS